MKNFDLKKFLVENKLTTNSKTVNEEMDFESSNQIQAKISPDNRVAYLTSALDHVWKMGTGKNSIDYQSLAQSIIDDLFGADIE